MMKNVSLVVATLFLGLCITKSYAGHSSASGHIWTPDGIYESSSATATLDFSGSKTGKIIMGNACALQGRISMPNKSKPNFNFTITGLDGVGCPNIKRINIKIVDGYAVHAIGNASKIRLSHTKSSKKGLVDFSGSYKFVGSID